MRSFVLISAICLQLGWGNAKGFSNGVGAFSYQDSKGTRYEGTYGLKDGEVVDAKGTFPPDFTPPTDFQPPIFDDTENSLGFFPEYFRNLENLLQDPDFTYYGPTPQNPQNIPTYSHSPWPAYIPDYGGQSYNRIPNYTAFELPNYNIPNHEYHTDNINRAFQANLDGQKLALDAAHKAFDLTSNQAGISPNLNPSRSSFYDHTRFGGFPNMPRFPSGFPFRMPMPMPMPNFGNNANSAFASAASGPGYNHQIAAISPSNPNSPNIVKTSQGSGIPGGYRSVSVSSYSSSSDINGKKTNKQGSQTYIDDNGKITDYSVHSP